VKVSSVAAMTGDRTLSLPASEYKLQLNDVGSRLCGDDFLSGAFRLGPD
jgi:hypothetical protein